MIDLEKYRLKEKYRKVLDHLNDDDKIKLMFKKYRSINTIKDIVTYYELENNKLLRECVPDKYKKNPKYAYDYAENVIKDRWIEAEEYIKKNSLWAYNYALFIIKDRWLEAEEYIKKDPEHASYYAIDVIEGRWKEAEEYIKTDPFYAYLYARDVTKGRWLEAEEYIKNSDYAYNYALDVIGDKDFWK